MRTSSFAYLTIDNASLLASVRPLLPATSIMKEIKFVIIGAAILGIIASFLPYISAQGISLTFWDFHKMPSSISTGLLNGPKQVYVALVCFAVPAVIAVMAMMGKLARWHGITAAVFFLATFAVEGVRKGMTGGDGISTAIGGKLLFLAALVGLVGAVVATAKPEQA